MGYKERLKDYCKKRGKPGKGIDKALYRKSMVTMAGDYVHDWESTNLKRLNNGSKKEERKSGDIKKGKRSKKDVSRMGKKIAI